jgi:hypothetical protein
MKNPESKNSLGALSFIYNIKITCFIGVKNGKYPQLQQLIMTGMNLVPQPFPFGLRSWG